jgi:Domain of unknown function (DUF3368)
MGLQVSGTLGLLKRAAQRNLLDLAEAFTLLKKTDFRYRPEMMEALLARAEKFESTGFAFPHGMALARARHGPAHSELLPGSRVAEANLARSKNIPQHSRIRPTGV